MNFFRMHPALCAAAPALFKRGGGLWPKVDAWVLMALHARATSVQKDQRGYSFEAEFPCVTIPYEPAALFAILAPSGEVEPTCRGVGGPNAWRDLAGAMKRLEDVDARFPVMVRNGRKLKRFHGGLVRRERDIKSVVLHCCPPPGVGYFALVPYEVFKLRAQLGETASAMLLWLCYFQRGSKPKGGTLRHRWEVDIERARLQTVGLIACAPGRKAETWARLLTALQQLALAKVLTLEIVGDAARVSLSRDLFHRDEE